MEKKNKKKNKLKGGKIIFVFLFLIVLACSGILGYKYLLSDNFKSSVVSKISELKIDSPKTYKTSLVMVGDCLLHQTVYNDAYVSNNKYDFKPMLKYIKPIVSKFDIAYYNQETIIGGKALGLSTYPMFNSPEEIGEDMLDAGFNLVSLANNHSYDKGIKGITNSVNYWKEKKDVITAGMYISKEDRDTIAIGQSNNITYAFLSYTTVLNGFVLPKGQEYLINLYDKEKVKKDIESVRDKVDVVIVAMHWGEEYTHTPTKEEKEIAKYLSELDVDIVIGAHPHVVQPIEYVGDTLVFYSLGNFLSSQIGTEKRVGLLASLDIKKTVIGDKSVISINNIDYELLYTYYNNSRKDFKVIPFSELNNNLLSNYEQVREKYEAVVNQNKVVTKDW